MCACLCVRVCMCVCVCVGGELLMQGAGKLLGVRYRVGGTS